MLRLSAHCDTCIIFKSFYPRPPHCYIYYFHFIYLQLFFELLYLLKFSQSDSFPQCSDETRFQIKAAVEMTHSQLAHNYNRKPNVSDFQQRAETVVATFSEHRWLNIQLGLCWDVKTQLWVGRDGGTQCNQFVHWPCLQYLPPPPSVYISLWFGGGGLALWSPANITTQL